MRFIRFPPSVVPVGEPEQAARERLSDNPVIWSSRGGGATLRRAAPGPRSAPARRGRTHRERESASRRCRQRTPREPRISTRSAEPVPNRPWGAGPDRTASPRPAREEAQRGIAATPVAAAGRSGELRRGDAPGPRPGPAERRNACRPRSRPRPVTDLRAVRRRGVSLLASQSGGSGNPAAIDREPRAARQTAARGGPVSTAA